MQNLPLLFLLFAVSACSSSTDPLPPQETTTDGAEDASAQEDAGFSAEELVSWQARIKSNLEPAIESRFGLRNRVEPREPGQPIRIVFLDLPPRSVPKELPNGQIKQVLNPEGAPSRMKLLVRDLIEELRLPVEGFEMYNGKLNPDDPTPFQ